MVPRKEGLPEAALTTWIIGSPPGELDGKAIPPIFPCPSWAIGNAVFCWVTVSK